MKKKISKNDEIMLFFRFLKDNDIFTEYINIIKIGIDSPFLYAQKYLKKNGLVKYLYRMFNCYDFFAPFFVCIPKDYSRNDWYNIEHKWHKYINNIYYS